jgi:glycosyl hydrolase family 39 (putative alpha-L-iduronidase)
MTVASRPPLNDPALKKRHRRTERGGAGPADPVSRRRFLRESAAVAATALAARINPVAAQSQTLQPPLRRIALVDSALAGAAGPQGPVRIDEFSTVGVFDADWLVEPRFTRLLDNMAASPGAFRTVRFFGALNTGEMEKVFPATSGIVWPAPDRPMDFSITVRALDALVSRGLVPFVGLTFFPAAVSPSPIGPPSDFSSWRKLVRAFLDRLVERYGPSEVRNWWFEAWNEPNMPPFWRGSFEQYLDLYRATSEVVRESGHSIRLGGPVIAYTPSDGPALMERFLAFLAREPAVKCDFISFHRKGIWTTEETEPRVEKLVAAAEATAQAVLRLVPDRAAHGLWIVNNEADMKVQFDRPYEPRMTEQFPAWLAAVTVAYDGLSAKYAAQGLRFLAAADDANQQLVQAPFDGRRSIMSRTSTSERSLVKVPVYNYYELLRLLGDRHGSFLSGAEAYFPNSDLFHMVTASDSHVSALFAAYSTGQAPGGPGGSDIHYTLQDIPWPRVNIVRFRIDATHSNAYTAAGRALSVAVADSQTERRVRHAQELEVDAPLQSGIELPDHTFRDRFDIEPCAAVLHWITPFGNEPPGAPSWLEASVEDGNVVLRWTPNQESFFYSYELFLLQPDGAPGRLLSPVPLRAAMWIDTAPEPGRRVYGVRAVSASGVRSDIIKSPPLAI